MEWNEIGKWAAGIIGTLAAAGFIFRFVFVKKSNSSERKTTQKSNRAGRDIIGGDKINKR